MSWLYSLLLAKLGGSSDWKIAALLSWSAYLYYPPHHFCCLQEFCKVQTFISLLIFAQKFIRWFLPVTFLKRKIGKQGKEKMYWNTCHEKDNGKIKNWVQMWNIWEAFLFFHPPQAADKETTSTNAKPYWAMGRHSWGRIQIYERLLGRANALTDLQGRSAKLPPPLPLKLQWCCLRALVCDQVLGLPHLSPGPLEQPASTDEQICHHQCQKPKAGVASLACLNKKGLNFSA